jgi:predicted Zn-dependent protease
MDRIETFRTLVARSPDNPLARFGLANELLKARRWQEAATELEAYLAAHDDEGNGWGRLAEARAAQGDMEGARAALRSGIEASRRHGHPGMASELEMRLDEVDDA